MEFEPEIHLPKKLDLEYAKPTLEFVLEGEDIGNPPHPERPLGFREIERDWSKLNTLLSNRSYRALTMEAYEIFLDKDGREICRRTVIPKMDLAEIALGEVIRSQEELLKLYIHYENQTREFLDELRTKASGPWCERIKRNKQVLEQILREHGFEPNLLDFGETKTNRVM